MCLGQELLESIALALHYQFQKKRGDPSQMSCIVRVCSVNELLVARCVEVGGCGFRVVVCRMCLVNSDILCPGHGCARKNLALVVFAGHTWSCVR